MKELLVRRNCSTWPDRSVKYIVARTKVIWGTNALSVASGLHVQDPSNDNVYAGNERSVVLR